MDHKTLEEHVRYACSNGNCKKHRNGEELDSHFEGIRHYASWKCEDCKTQNWFRVKMGSHVRHFSKL